jgi:hypothetical protein
MDEHTLTVAELDAMHAEAKAAFDRRDLSAYCALMSPELTYRQADGRIIGRDDLLRDVRIQFRRLSRVRSSFVRQSIEVDGDRAIETLTQTACVGATAFVVVHRTWQLTRRGRYTWRKQAGRWLIEAVEVIDETLGPGRWSLGFRAPDTA